MCVYHCPYCEKELQVVQVDSEGFDVLGCVDCAWDELSSELRLGKIRQIYGSFSEMITYSQRR
jgi:Zn ribbon nucleic-acid-binding protein